MPTVTITIGLNSNQTLQPLPLYLANRFRDAVNDLLFAVGAVIYVQDAGSTGTWQDVKSGKTVHEESRTWVAEVESPAYIKEFLPALCEQFEQDAIAFTTGETELVSSTTV